MSIFIGMAKYIINGLVKKYAELSGGLQASRKESRRIKSAMVHVEAVIKLYKKDYDTASIKSLRLYRRRHPNFQRGTYSRVAMDVLREAKEPLPISGFAACKYGHYAD